MKITKKALTLSLGLLTLTLGISNAMADGGNWGDYDPNNIPPAGSVIPPHEHNGFYVGGYGGITVLPTTDLDAKITYPVPAPYAPENMALTSNTGFNGGILLGYDYKLLRFEANFDAAGASADTIQGIQGLSSGTYNVDGSTMAYSGFANLLLNVKTGPVNFFGGAGVGGLYQRYDLKSPNGAVNATFDEGDANVAFQGILGAGYNFNDQWELDFMYRYVQAASADIKVTNDTAQIATEITPTYSSNNFDLALRYFVA